VTQEKAGELAAGIAADAGDRCAQRIPIQHLRIEMLGTRIGGQLRQCTPQFAT
jgi:hypothetical protein